MKKIAEAGKLILFETTEGKGYILDTETNEKGPEKEIISLLSVSTDWVPVEDVAKQDEPRRYRDEMADAEAEFGITVGSESVQKEEEPIKDVPIGPKPGDPETYNNDEAGPKTA